MIYEIYNEDCVLTMQRMIDEGYKEVDTILTSPPYNNSRVSHTKHGMDTHQCRYDSYDDSMTNEEYSAWTIKLFNMFDKILKPNGKILYNISYGGENNECMWLTIADLIRETNFTIADVIIWKKNSALPNNVSTNKLTRITEYIFVICREDEYHTFGANKEVQSVNERTGQKFYKSITNLIEAENNDGVCNLNKATYSSSLCEQLLDIYTKEGSVVYDPFNGTGTTGVACMRKHMGKYIGSELSKAQCGYSIERIENTKPENIIKKTGKVNLWGDLI